LVSIEKSVSGFLKLEPLIANRADSAAICDGFNRLDLTRPSDAATDRVDRETSVSASPQTLVKQSAASLIDVIINALIIDTCADDTGDCGANVLND
jgi:hypothetical protein